ENEALYRLSTRVNEAAEPEELLAALVDETGSPDVQGKIQAIETAPSGQPEAVEVIAVHGGGPTVGSPVGARFDLRGATSVQLWTARPNEALVVEDLANDPRLDPAARAAHTANGLGAVILLPLRWHDRWLGLLQLGWAHARKIGDDQRRLFERIAPQAAAVLDNRLLLARSQRAIAENQAQAHTLEIVLDHLPVGVVIIDATNGQRRINRAGADLLADDEPDVREPLPLYHPDSDQPVAPQERLSRLVLAHGEVVSRERDLLGHDGTRRRLTVTAAPFRDEHGAILGTITLFHDITQQVRGEREREQLKEAVIAAQRAALAERATPLIPISAEILVLPLVGTIDPERGEQLVQTLGDLDGHACTRVVLVDLTGVRDLDGPGALALARAAGVLRLRGVTAIFTGIGDTVAWTLVDQNIDLRGLTTHATLRSGLAHAARLTGAADLAR
ncbi:MAG TPA: PAS domain-containing protein, partial [Nannocystis sp.]